MISDMDEWGDNDEAASDGGSGGEDGEGRYTCVLVIDRIK